MIESHQTTLGMEGLTYAIPADRKSLIVMIGDTRTEYQLATDTWIFRGVSRKGFDNLVSTARNARANDILRSARV
jgi:hypothetical protein